MANANCITIPFLPKPDHPKFIDIEGQTFNRLTVLGFVGSAGGQARWLCQCSCGLFAIVSGKGLRSGNTKSCGCWNQVAARQRMWRHGNCRTQMYGIWSNIISRTENPNVKSFQDYGERGITMCRRWRNSFEDFSADVGDRPTPKHTLERIDNNGNYEPDNVKWALPLEQANNKRNNRMLTFQGRTQSLAMWCRELHLNYDRIKSRLHRGMSVENALLL